MSNNAPLLIDVSRLIWRRWENRRPTGIDRVCLAYVEHYRPQAQAVIQVPGFRRILDEKNSDLLFSLLVEEQTNFQNRLIIQGIQRTFSIFPPLGGKQRPYLNVGHTGLDKPQLRHWTTRTGVRPVFFIHDLIPITHPEHCREGEEEKHRQRMRTALETGTGIIGNSRATLDELNEFAAREDLAKLPQISSWLGGANLKPTVQSLPSHRPYFVTLGTIEGRKNHLLLLNIWRQLVAEQGAEAPQLRIIGQRGWEAKQVFAMLDRNRSLQDYVIEINDCSDDALADHLAHTRALLFPSVAEGYGLPLIEALAQAIPVIASNIPIFREIAGDIPDYLDPHDGPGWKHLISDFCRHDSSRRRSQLQRMGGYAVPDWQAHFDVVDRWLEELYGVSLRLSQNPAPAPVPDLPKTSSHSTSERPGSPQGSTTRSSY